MASATMSASSQSESEAGVDCPVASATKSTVVFVGLTDDDIASLDSVFRQCDHILHIDSEWTFIARPAPAAAYATLESSVSIIICDADMSAGVWREMLERLSLLTDPPLLILASRLADERLWAEALNLGAWDVLAKPFDRTEAARTVAVAWQHWHARRDVLSPPGPEPLTSESPAANRRWKGTVYGNPGDAAREM